MVCDKYNVEKLKIDAGGFGMSPRHSNFNMECLIQGFKTGNGQMCGVYGVEEIFLTLVIHPLLKERNTLYIPFSGPRTFSTESSKPYRELLGLSADSRHRLSLKGANILKKAGIKSNITPVVFRKRKRYDVIIQN